MSNFEKMLLNILHNYATLIDAGKFNDVAKLLSHSTIFDPDRNVLAQGEKEIAQMYTSMIRIYPDTGTPKTQHIVSDFKIESEQAEQVISTAVFTVLQKLSSGETTTIIKGVYRNVFQKIGSDHRWAMVEHQMTPTMIGDMSEHLLISLSQQP